MKISVFVLIAALTLVIAAMASAQGIVNGTCDQGLSNVSATAGSTALTGWVFNTQGVSNGPIGNYYIGTNVSNWNQRPGYTVAGVGSVFHANPATRAVQYVQSVTGLVAGANYNVSAWFMSSKVTGQPSGATLTLKVQNPEIPGWASSPAYGSTPETQQVWGESIMPVTASSTGAVDIRIYITLGDGAWGSKLTPNAVFDDVTITQVIPEPGSMIALMSGLVGLVGFGIRRRK